MADIIDIASKEVGYKAYGGNKTICLPPGVHIRQVYQQA